MHVCELEYLQADKEKGMTSGVVKRRSIYSEKKKQYQIKPDENRLREEIRNNRIAVLRWAVKEFLALLWRWLNGLFARLPISWANFTMLLSKLERLH